MILTGPEIQKRVAAGSIEITPYNADQVNPASYDLRLGDQVVQYRRTRKLETDHYVPRSLDAQKNNDTYKWTFEEMDGSFELSPGELYLMHTEEIVCSHNTVPVLDGKSSVARLGISAHLTAGFGDIGFRGQYTLEVTVVHPVVVYAGMRFCQIRFHEVTGEIQKYDGNYQGETAMGPVPSRSWKQFKEKSK